MRNLSQDSQCSFLNKGDQGLICCKSVNIHVVLHSRRYRGLRTFVPGGYEGEPMALNLGGMTNENCFLMAPLDH